MKHKILLITGGEICHSYFCNQLRLACNTVTFDIIQFKSKIPDFNYFYEIYSNNLKNESEKRKIIEFIFRRNLTFAQKQNYTMLQLPLESVLCSDLDEFDNKLEKALETCKYKAVFLYGAPIIKSQQLLEATPPCFNIHLGLSSSARGGDANIFSLAEKNFTGVGLTCHLVTPEIDNGSTIFEIKEINLANIFTIDELNYILIEKALKKIAAIINLGLNQLNCYTVPVGKMYLNKQMEANIVIKAEKHLKLSSFES